MRLGGCARLLQLGCCSRASVCELLQRSLVAGFAGVLGALLQAKCLVLGLRRQVLRSATGFLSACLQVCRTTVPCLEEACSNNVPIAAKRLCASPKIKCFRKAKAGMRTPRKIAQKDSLEKHDRSDSRASNQDTGYDSMSSWSLKHWVQHTPCTHGMRNTL